MMPLIVGTAGHIDHGKTALIRALTGQDTDRLKEERERGISIDLGFAYFDGPDGTRLGVVDVPGHERFIRNMLAGAHGMDLVLFTVAADDGVMPQSEEHLDIMHLLGVERGIFVVTKTDLVDAARIDTVREEIEILAAGTSLEGVPVVAVSAKTGAGMDELRATIARELRRETPAESSHGFRLPVDRAFVVKGHGVVVTGTAVSGRIEEGASVRLMPSGELARVRGIEVHGEAVRCGHSRQRLALNLAGLDRTEVTRGMVVCDPAIDRSTQRLDVWLEVRPGRGRRVVTHGRVRLHIGTAEILAKVVLLQDQPRLAAGHSGWAQLVLREPVVGQRGDRFVVRDETGRWTIGGGEVVHPFASHHRRGEAGVLEALGALRGADLVRAAAAFLRLGVDFASHPREVARVLGVDDVELTEALADAEGVVTIPSQGEPEAVTTTPRWRRFEEAVCERVAQGHRESPLAPGIDLEHVRSQLPWPVAPRVFRWGVEQLVLRGRLAREQSLVRTPTHRVELGEDRRRLGTRVEQVLAEAGLTPPDLRVLSERLDATPRELTDVTSVLAREGRLIRVSEDLYYHPEAVREGTNRLREYCAVHGEVTAAAFRDLIGASRKFAIAFLDWCDRTGVTVRIGDVRKLRR